ncbi:TRAP transporter substrate-binding protein [Oricola thermophila]|uniref:TRAP transporter substrate-binding protein n=1 Tax=Oricola thermophila TaxID=2742145 RepID=A0A6N1VCF6_9HYPH|nr:TRAP transporter substrate-binding protein [Oricola thermophila]QKV18554.1 TRAP transporter substrate-binding protein [Oricola thermophila]
MSCYYGKIALAGGVLLGLVGAASAQTEIVLAHVFPANSQEQRTAEAFAEQVAELSGGEMEVSVFPASQLGGWAQIANQQQSGAVNVTFISTSALGGFSELATVDAWPFLFDERSQFDAAYASEDGKAFFNAIEADSGYRVLAPVYKGARYVYLNKEADSLEGQRIRAPGLPVVLASFEAWNGSPTPMSVAELYTAMQQGVVDGVEIEAQTAVSLGVADITETVLLTRHMMPNYAFIFWGAWLDSLPDDQRAVIEQAAQVASDGFGSGIEEAEQASLTVFEEAGSRLVEVDRAAMREASETALREQFPDLVEWVDRLRAAGGVQ